MKWEEFLNTEVDDLMLDVYNAVKTDIECPDCGRPIYMNNTVLIGLPSQYRYWCVCGWNDCVPLKWKNEIHNTPTAVESEDRNLIEKTDWEKGYEKGYEVGMNKYERIIGQSKTDLKPGDEIIYEKEIKAVIMDMDEDADTYWVFNENGIVEVLSLDDIDDIPKGHHYSHFDLLLKSLSDKNNIWGGSKND